MYEMVDGLTDDSVLDSSVLILCKMMADGDQIYHLVKMLYHFLKNLCSSKSMSWSLVYQNYF